MPVFVVVSKVDVCVGGAVQKTVRQLERLLKLPGCNKVPMLISNRDDAVTAAQRFAQSSRYALADRPRLITYPAVRIICPFCALRR